MVFCGKDKPGGNLLASLGSLEGRIGVVACRLLARARALVPNSAALHFLSKPLPKESWHLKFFWKMVCGSLLISLHHFEFIPSSQRGYVGPCVGWGRRD